MSLLGNSTTNWIVVAFGEMPSPSIVCSDTLNLQFCFRRGWKIIQFVFRQYIISFGGRGNLSIILLSVGLRYCHFLVCRNERRRFQFDRYAQTKFTNVKRKSNYKKIQKFLKTCGNFGSPFIPINGENMRQSHEFNYNFPKSVNLISFLEKYGNVPYLFGIYKFLEIIKTDYVPLQFLRCRCPN